MGIILSKIPYSRFSWPLSKNRFQGQTISFWSRVKHQNTTSNITKLSCSIDLISLAPGPCCGVELAARNTPVSRPVIWRSLNVHHLSGSCLCSVNGFKLSTGASVNWHVLIRGPEFAGIGCSISGGQGCLEAISYSNFEITENLQAWWFSGLVKGLFKCTTKHIIVNVY